MTSKPAFTPDLIHVCSEASFEIRSRHVWLLQTESGKRTTQKRLDQTAKVRFLCFKSRSPCAAAQSVDPRLKEIACGRRAGVGTCACIQVQGYTQPESRCQNTLHQTLRSSPPLETYLSTHKQGPPQSRVHENFEVRSIQSVDPSHPSDQSGVQHASNRDPFMDNREEPPTMGQR